MIWYIKRKGTASPSPTGPRARYASCSTDTTTCVFPPRPLLLLNVFSVSLLGVSQTTVATRGRFRLVQVDVHFRVALQSRALVSVTDCDVSFGQVHDWLFGNQLNGSIRLRLGAQIFLNKSLRVARNHLRSAFLARRPLVGSVWRLHGVFVVSQLFASKASDCGLDRFGNRSLVSDSASE